MDRDQILRVNCPGYGQPNFFSAGYADPLQSYSVIVVNPTSILHLFDKDPEIYAQIENAQKEGLASYSAKNDKLLESLLPDLSERMLELEKFLERGGLLLYFLCPPFLVHGPKIGLDNYGWLEALAPDKSQEKNKRNMSSASRGKNIEPTAAGLASPFAEYLQQPGLEWTTVIRTANLTEGYQCLAISGPNKCIAADLAAGDNGGTVMFLPAPYQVEFDAKLVECLEIWFARRVKPLSPWQPVSVQQETADFNTVARGLFKESGAGTTEEAPSAVQEETAVSVAAPEDHAVASDERQESTVPEVDNLVSQGEDAAKGPVAASPQREEIMSEAGAMAVSSQEADQENVQSRAGELMGKMEEITRDAVPDWCEEYSFSDLDELRDELVDLNKQMQLMQVRIEKVQNRIHTIGRLKNALLSADGVELHDACVKVLQSLDWVVKDSSLSDNELWLVEDGSAQGIVRIVRTTSQAKPVDLRQLAESVINYWSEHEEEPKGILLASTWANRPPSERTDQDFTDSLADFAQKKNFCLMTTWQLLCIYLDVERGHMTASELRQIILSTNGRLQGFSLDAVPTASG